MANNNLSISIRYGDRRLSMTFPADDAEDIMSTLIGYTVKNTKKTETAESSKSAESQKTLNRAILP
jgi:hypothetical protein